MLGLRGGSESAKESRSMVMGAFHQGVNVDNQTALTVQSLLESTTLSNEVLPPGGTVISSRPSSAITLDEEDVFQCGRCKKQFTSFTMFMCHKKDHAAEEHLAGLRSKEESLSLSLDEGQQERAGGGYSQEREEEVGQPIILSDSDILSFSIDQSDLNISNESQVLPSLSQVIQNGTFLTSGESSSSLKSLPGVETGSNLGASNLKCDSIILAEEPFVPPDNNMRELGETVKIVEYSSSTEAHLEFMDTSVSAVEFVTQQPQPMTEEAELLLSNMVEPHPQPNDKPVENTDGHRPNSKSPKLRCKYCSKQFMKNFDLQQHVRTHTGEKPFQCVVCGRAFSQKSNVKKHMTTHKVWPEGMSSTLPEKPLQPVPARKEAFARGSASVQLLVDRSYVCQYCSTRFKSYFELKTHMKLHSHQKVYWCIQKNCQQTFPDLDSFVNHTRTHSSEVLYRCHVCNKQFNTLADLGIHQYSHNTKTPMPKIGTRFFCCTKCKSKFSSPESLDHHMATCSHSYPCSQCGKVFACERYLRRHLATHGTALTYQCQQCGKSFRTESYLNTHMVTHSSLKPHVCEHCQAAFNRKDKLVRHLLIHEVVKKYKCPFRTYLGCPKEFNRSDKLKLHILTHSAVRPAAQCRVCGKSFQRQSQLRQHDRTYHQMAPHKCQQCGIGFKKKVSLVAHECGQLEEGETVQRAPIKLQQSRRVIRKTRPRGRSRREPARVDSNVTDKPGDNVPTIEIIVMPVSLQQHEAPGDTNAGGMYHVVLPGESQAEAVYYSREDQQDQEVPVAATTL